MPVDASIRPADANKRVDHQKYLSAKQKVEKFILSQDLNIGMMFAVIDTNSDSEIQLNEFKQKLRAMRIQLEEDEMHAFFRGLDKNNSGTIDFGEFVNEFADINTDKFIQKMKKTFNDSKVDPAVIFDKYAVNDSAKKKMNHTEFVNLLKFVVRQQLIPQEIHHLKRAFDRGNKGFVTKEDFLNVVYSDFVEK